LFSGFRNGNTLFMLRFKICYAMSCSGTKVSTRRAKTCPDFPNWA